ncbi:hypothetical protein J6X15_00410 [Candidatus Saccharibacteria bacterium]|nr:hypothetical protein [Candidatus Saccharibacteria bacterium]
MEKKDVFYAIENGPSRDTLLDALKYACDKNANVTVDFEVIAPPSDGQFAGKRVLIADWRIMGVSHEDGSGNSFNIFGSCKANVRHVGIKYVDFKAYYNTRTRKGNVHFIG